jgi:hypothetical protein
MGKQDQWRRCSACKKPISTGALYYVCSVSTCNRPRTGLVFCDVSCWDFHLPTARHRQAWAEEMTAPDVSAAQHTATPSPKRASAAKPARPPKRSIVRPGSTAPADPPAEVLIVGSRLKDYVRARAGMNTSDRVLEPLSEIVRAVCDEAIRNAAQDGRKTVLDRDIPRRR